MADKALSTFPKGFLPILLLGVEVVVVVVFGIVLKDRFRLVFICAMKQQVVRKFLQRVYDTLAAFLHLNDSTRAGGKVVSFGCKLKGHSEGVEFLEIPDDVVGVLVQFLVESLVLKERQ